MKVIVYHSEYGCETGCCGHTVEVTKEDGSSEQKFDFDHPYGEDPREFAETLVREQFGTDHVADLDWDNCIISDW